MTGILDPLRGFTLVAATLTMGLIAGLFYAYTCSVMPGLARASDTTLIETMQRINVAILNGWFFLTFLGALALTFIAALLHLSRSGRPALPWIAAAFVLYLAVIIITARLNIPLNNALDAAGDPHKLADPATVRANFEAAWVRWNLARTLSSTAAFGCLLGALIQFARTTA